VGSFVASSSSMVNLGGIPSDINYQEEIERLKKQHNAVIVAHYYQDDEIQDLADFIGDSLDLSKKASSIDADVIVFCGVVFMAEVAKILNPKCKVIVPDENAGCSLESSCQPVAFSAFRQKYPDHIAITYINCSADIKALSDIIVTSSNAENIINQLPQDQKIIFAPDKFLGGYLAKKTGRDMVLWQGTCIVHEQFSERELIRLKNNHENAKIIAHPECPSNLLSHADHIGSTKSLINYTKHNDGGEFIILTEPGIIHQMKKLSPNSSFYSVPGVAESCQYCNKCPFMRLNSIEKLYLALKNLSPEISLDDKLITAAKAPLDKMLKMS